MKFCNIFGIVSYQKFLDSIFLDFMILLDSIFWIFMNFLDSDFSNFSRFYFFFGFLNVLARFSEFYFLGFSKIPGLFFSFWVF